MNIIFMGSAEFGLTALEALIAAGHTIIGVVTTPDRPSGRGLKLTPSPVALYAEKHALAPLFKPDSLKDSAFATTLAALNADLFVVVAFRILPELLFSIPPLGTVNIHASLLPRYRGPAPIHRAVEAGDTETGVTVFTIDRGIDTGSILVQERTPIGPAETTPELYERLAALGAVALIKAVALLAAHEKGCGIIQNHAETTKAPKLSKEESVIDWNLPAVSIFNKIRAFKPFPGTVTTINGARLAIESAHLDANCHDDHAPELTGTITAIEKEHFRVACGRGTLIIDTVKPEGKRSMRVAEYLCGTTLVKGTRLS